ncbi:hypothetical protein BS329_38745 [Amycolatopsis coloradensis]|uniref:Uncharacterized protein n=1 Tax=Amycolatopsis coloradensis TaxID=76021 RepID=A0A1R0KEQ5_9PSEU|nr:hypothetical protein [Amycolatopsis coloradensis]OLZ43598.1 hypothetical protein BS329_38745 [Amycolatopsis coloradensis]
MTRYNQSAYQKVTWWSMYGRAVGWFSVMWVFVLLPLVVLFFVDSAQAWQKFYELAISLGILIPSFSLMVWWKNRDEPHTVDELIERQNRAEVQK